MLSLPGRMCKLCDGYSRREFLRVGGATFLGLSLPQFFSLQANAAPGSPFDGSRGYGQAKSVILLFLQGGPSHIDIWDPKPDAPSNIRGEFKPIKTNVDGIQLSETMPLIAKMADKFTLNRSMSYTPAGLFNHTAAIYQMLTGYPPDKVSPSGQLEPPSPRDFPTAGAQVSKLKPLDDPYAAVRGDAAPAPGIERHRQRRIGGFPREGLRSLPALPGPEQAYRSGGFGAALGRFPPND